MRMCVWMCWMNFHNNNIIFSTKFTDAKWRHSNRGNHATRTFYVYEIQTNAIIAFEVKKKRSDKYTHIQHKHTHKWHQKWLLHNE